MREPSEEREGERRNVEGVGNTNTIKITEPWLWMAFVNFPPTFLTVLGAKSHDLRIMHFPSGFPLDFFNLLFLLGPNIGKKISFSKLVYFLSSKLSKSHTL